MNLQLLILQNTQTGKDTHIRQIKLFGPRKQPTNSLGELDMLQSQSVGMSKGLPDKQMSLGQPADLLGSMQLLR